MFSGLRRYSVCLLWIAWHALVLVACTTSPRTETPSPWSTDDPSTPAPPANAWTTYRYKTGLSFKYPANWFILVQEELNRVVILNAPPYGMAAVKGGADEFIAIHISLNPENIQAYGSVQAYIDATVRKSIAAENLLSVETLPTSPQGYVTVSVTHLGEGEGNTLYVANKDRVTTLASLYVPGRKSQKKYLPVMEQIAGTLIIP